MEVQSQFIEMLSNSGYEEKSLGELCDKMTDGSHNPPKGNDGSEYLMISSKNVFIDGLDLADVRYLSKDEFDLENKRTEVKKNDILLTIVGTIGRTYLVKGNEGNIVMQRSVAVLKPSDKVNPLFMMYSLHIDENLEKEGRGNAQKGVYLKQLSQFKIKVPSLDIQNNFCSIYQQADKSKFVGFKSQFIEMFGDFYTSAESTLADYVNLKAGKSKKAELIRDSQKDAQYPCYGGNGIRGYVDDFTHNGTYCIIGRQGALCGNVQIAHGQFYATEHAVVVSPIVEINTTWLFFALTQMNLNQYARGVAQPGLAVNQIEKLSFSLPSLDGQNRFASIAVQADKSKYYNQVA